jgi:hypothetical protein
LLFEKGYYYVYYFAFRYFWDGFFRAVFCDGFFLDAYKSGSKKQKKEVLTGSKGQRVKKVKSREKSYKFFKKS